MACSKSKASGPRTSPTMMRSGRMRRQFFTRSRMVTWPSPSRFGGRVSRRTTCGCCNCSSAASSQVTIRSSSSMKRVRQLSSVVLPEPVPPEISVFTRQRPMILRISAPSGEIEPNLVSCSSVSLSFLNLRMVSAGPSIASGGTMAFTREPHHGRGDQRLQRPVTKHGIADVVEQIFLLGDRHHDVFDRDDFVDDVADFLARGLTVELGELGKVDRLDQGAEDRRLDLVVAVRTPGLGDGGR